MLQQPQKLSVTPKPLFEVIFEDTVWSASFHNNTYTDYYICGTSQSVWITFGIQKQMLKIVESEKQLLPNVILAC